MQELSVIQKTYDLIKWYVPILNKLPKDYKFSLGQRTTEMLYGILELLLEAKYAKQKHAQLERVNISLAKLRYQTRLLFDFSLFSVQRYEYVSKRIDEIGTELGAWLKQTQSRTHEASR